MGDQYLVQVAQYGPPLQPPLSYGTPECPAGPLQRLVRPA